MPVHLLFFYSACACDVLLLWVLDRAPGRGVGTRLLAAVLFALTVGLFHEALVLMQRS
jgi:hypothetical protein